MKSHGLVSEGGEEGGVVPFWDGRNCLFAGVTSYRSVRQILRNIDLQHHVPEILLDHVKLEVKEVKVNRLHFYHCMFATGLLQTQRRMCLMSTCSSFLCTTLIMIHLWPLSSVDFFFIIYFY